MPEIHEACGLGVDELQAALTLLIDSHFVSLHGSYPFDGVKLQGPSIGDESAWHTVLERCDSTGTPLETVIVDLHLERLFGPG